MAMGHARYFGLVCGPQVKKTAVSATPKRLRWSKGSVLAFGTQVREIAPGRSRRIFRAKKSSARLPSEGK